MDSSILKFVSQYRISDEKVGDTLYSQVVSNILGNVKRLLPVNLEYPISQLVEGIYGSIKSQNMDGFWVRDPLGNGFIYEKEISKIVVFCLGGGTYTELKSLKSLKAKINIPIIYGSTEMINSSKFLQQIRNCL
jgi:hypothetical protein